VAHIPGALFFDLDGIVDLTIDVRNVSGYTLHPHFFFIILVEVDKQQRFPRVAVVHTAFCKSHVLRFCHQMETYSFN